MPLVTQPAELEELLPSLLLAGRVGFDLEANGRFAYRARVCMVQLRWAERTILVDTLVIDPTPLRHALGDAGPVKVVHDVSFDARMLAEVGVSLGNVHDTAVAAQMLGRPATGLASLAASELGIVLDKSMQSHDWARRPLDPKMLAYLETDVLHLDALHDKLWAEASDLGIEAEILEETRYRLASSIRAAREPDPRPAYARIKGIDKLAPVEHAIVRRLAEVREREAEQMDVPANELVGNAALLEIARGRPDTVEALKKIHGAMPRHRGYPVARELVRAIPLGVADGDVPAEERGWLERPRIPPEAARLYRERETRLLAWRKAEALARKVNEQVVLPGHCVKDLVVVDVSDGQRLAEVPGLGAFRTERYGDAIVRALLTPAPPAG